jgi:methylated-DNA-protein-cysteine methyltransferase related protein
MPKSPAFIRIKADVLKMVSAIPVGKLCSYRSIGEHLDVMPRHVAYILSQLGPEDKTRYPWYRVVADDGNLGVPKFGADGRTQADLLRDEGAIISAKNSVLNFEKLFITAARLKSGVPKQQRPAEYANTSLVKPKLISNKK